MLQRWLGLSTGELMTRAWLAIFFRFRVRTQSFLPIQPIDPLGIHVPPISSQQHREASIAKSHSGRRQLPQAHPQSFLSIPMALVS